VRRRAVAAALALLALAGAPAFRALAPAAAAQDKDKDKEKKDKDAERKKKEEEEERKKREKARLEKAITAIANGFAAEDASAVLLNVADDAKVVLRLAETDKKGESSYSKDQAKGVLDAFFKAWKVIRVDTGSMSVDQNVASFPLELFKDSAEGTKMGKRLRIKVGSAEDRHPLVKLVVEW
jgi:hypothetical protein